MPERFSEMKEIASVLGKIRKLRRSVGYLDYIKVLAVCFLSSIIGFAVEQKPATAPKSARPEPVAPAPPVAIPLADIAARVTEVSNVLGKLTASAARPRPRTCLARYTSLLSANIGPRSNIQGRRSWSRVSC